MQNLKLLRKNFVIQLLIITRTHLLRYESLVTQNLKQNTYVNKYVINIITDLF